MRPANASGIRKVRIGSFPVAGRPLFLGATFFLDAAIFKYYP